jgi:hypothetical protein
MLLRTLALVVAVDFGYLGRDETADLLRSMRVRMLRFSLRSKCF